MNPRNNSPNPSLPPPLCWLLIRSAKCHGSRSYDVRVPNWTYGTTEPDPGTYDGRIVERDLVDGRVQVTVQITATDLPIHGLYQRVFDSDWNLIANTPYFEDGGTMDNLTFTIRFILDYPGQEIPSIFAINQDKIYSRVSGVGNGNFCDEAAALGYTPGASVKVMINDTSLDFAGEMSDDHPTKASFGSFYPVSMINIMQVGI